MQCQPPAGFDDNSHLYDMCWLDDITLAMIQGNGKKVFLANIDSESKTCDFRVIDSGYKPLRVSCSPDGASFYVTDGTNGRVMVYNRAGIVEAWNPQGLVVRPLTVAVNNKLVVVGVDTSGPVYVYNRHRQFLYRLRLEGIQGTLWNTFLTEQDLFLSVPRSPDNRFNIHNLKDNTTITAGAFGDVDGQLNNAEGAATAGNVIYVSTSYNSIRIFRPNGEFLQELQFVGGGVNKPWFIAVTPSNHLLAVVSEPHNRVRIYSLSP